MLAVDDIPEDFAEQISREYQDFAYIVSHDLNAPLRHVREFTRLLIGTRQSAVSEEEQQYIEFLEKSLNKLDDMQRALLAFSRLNTHQQDAEEINCRGIVQKVLEDMAGDIQKLDAHIECGDLPVIRGQQEQIRMLFSALLDNALKFHVPYQPIKISIAADRKEHGWLFQIRDNGIGISEAHLEEVFRMFRRLDPEKYPGTGAGLTIARKIVQNHGGQIFISSNPGAGASVYFSLSGTGIAFRR